MPTRSELIEAIELTGCGFASATADDLLARWPHIAGPRTITTVEELDALPVGTLVLDEDSDFCTRYDYGWSLTNHEDGVTTEVWLPATVLFRPDAAPAPSRPDRKDD